MQGGAAGGLGVCRVVQQVCVCRVVQEVGRPVQQVGCAGRCVQGGCLHDLQIYGIVVTIFLCFVVVGGVKMINRVRVFAYIPLFTTCMFKVIYLMFI